MAGDKKLTKQIDLSIVPLFKCNLRCPFCYLGKLRDEDSLLDASMLQHIFEQYSARVVDIYGGEVSLLKPDYIDQLVIESRCEQLYVTSNTIGFCKSRWLDYAESGEIEVSFSYDKLRPMQDLIRKNLQEIDKIGFKYSLICTDSSDVDIDFIRSLKNIKALSIKPISMSIYMDGSFKQDSHMLQIYKKLFQFEDLFQKLETTTKFRDSVPHYFLLPNGKLHDIQYKDGKEYFCEMSECQSSLDNNCLSCKYYKSCFNEHYTSYSVPRNGECLGRKATMEFIDGIRKNSLREAYKQM